MRLLAVLTVFLLGAAVPVRAAEPPPPVAAYAMPLVSQLSVSPDGTKVAYLAPVRGRKALVIRKLLPGPDDVPSLISGEDFRIRWFEWVNDSRLIIGVGAVIEVPGPSRKLPRRVTRLMAVNSDGSDLRVVLEPNRRNPYIIGAGDQVIQFIDREHILVAFPSGRDPWPDVVKVNVYTGASEVVARGRPNLLAFLPDPTGEARIAVGFDDDTRTQTWFYRSGRNAAFENLHSVRMGADAAFGILGFGKDPDILYVASAHESDRLAVYEYDLRTRRFGRKVAGDPDYDVAGAVFRNGRVVGVSYTRDLPVVTFFDPAEQALQAQIDKAIPGSTEIILDRTADGRFTLVASHNPREPVTYRLFDRDTRSLDFFADTFPALPAEHIGERRRVTYAARDGLAIPAYLTLPQGRTPTGLPLIVMPHGGPSARDNQTFDPHAQFLAGRGYAVLQPNFRGSTGYGNAFAKAGEREWGGKMQQDVVDGVRWVIDQGIADPQRICILGWSYGGYAALMGAVQSSDLFRCAVATAPVANLVRLYKELRWSPFKDYARTLFFGDDPDTLRPVSPVHQADKVAVPVLLIHGDMDVQAYVQHSRDMVEALKEAGKPFEYIEIEGMDHGPDSTEQTIRILTAWERFLSAHIGPGAPRTGP